MSTRNRLRLCVTWLMLWPAIAQAEHPLEPTATEDLWMWGGLRVPGAGSGELLETRSALFAIVKRFDQGRIRPTQAAKVEIAKGWELTQGLIDRWFPELGQLGTRSLGGTRAVVANSRILGRLHATGWQLVERAPDANLHADGFFGEISTYESPNNGWGTIKVRVGHNSQTNPHEQPVAGVSLQLDVNLGKVSVDWAPAYLGRKAQHAMRISTYGKGRKTTTTRTLDVGQARPRPGYELQYHRKDGSTTTVESRGVRAAKVSRR